MLKQTGWMQASLAVAALAALCCAPAAHAQGGMTKDKIIQYYELFNAGDPHYADLLADDVEFPHITGKMLHGKKAVMDFYANMEQGGVKDTRVPSTIVIDNDQGIAVIELTVHITGEPGGPHTLPTGEPLQPGEVLEGHSVMFYSFKNGKITSIRGAATGPSKFVKIK